MASIRSGDGHLNFCVLTKKQPKRKRPGPEWSCDGRVVKALDLKSNGIFPRRFEPCSQRNHFLGPVHIIAFGMCRGQFSRQRAQQTAFLKKKAFRARPGFEPGTSRTLSENHAPRPTSHAQLDRHSWLSTCAPSCLNVTGRINGQKVSGLVRDLNPGPLAPEARIIPLDQRASNYSQP